MSEPVKSGDVVLLHYTLVLKDENKVLETTIEEVAKEQGIYSDKATYKPTLLIIGAGEVPAGLEEAITGMNENEEKEIEVPPEKGFGRRDPDKVRVLPARLFSSQGVIPRAGEEVEIRGERGTIVSVGSGRVIVDFNHPLAGKSLLYKVKIVKVVRNVEEKTRALLEKYIGVVEGVEVKVEGDAIILNIPFHLLHSSDFIERIERFARDLEKHVNEVTTLKLESTMLRRMSETPVQQT
ncbi:MAG: peptidylprolyl isomerase [Thermofilaceae archaeon]